jgi:magnesium chelatase family protein
VPRGNAPEAGLVPGLSVLGAADLRSAAAFLSGQAAPPSSGDEAPRPRAPASPPPDLAEVAGQQVARRALEIAAAGAHALLFVGPPGCGKTMLAERLPGILPPFAENEALETAQIYSAAGEPPWPSVPERRPFRAPHFSISTAGLVGGGNPPRPGEISFAHGGVLFLDELGEFGRGAREALRLPLESGEIRIARAGAACRFPSRFLLAAAANPCSCVAFLPVDTNGAKRKEPRLSGYPLDLGRPPAPEAA